MCGGGGGSSGPSAADMEKQRQARINQGMQQVNNTFGQFNDDYYGGIRNAYMDYVQPDFNKQYEDAQRQLTLALARQGVSSSSIAADRQSNLQDLYNRNQLQLQQKADGYVNDRRSAVEGARGAVVSQLNASGNAGQAGQQAIAQASSLQALPEFSPLGNLFGAATDGLRYQMAAEQNGVARRDTGLFGGGAPSTSSGASRIVN